MINNHIVNTLIKIIEALPRGIEESLNNFCFSEYGPKTAIDYHVVRIIT